MNTLETYVPIGLQRIQELYGVPPWLTILFAVLMFGGWSAVYFVIIKRCFKEKTYGIPVVSACTNIVWETIFTLNLAGLISQYLRFGNALWMVPDSIILFQIYRYGKKEQTIPWVKDNFYIIVTSTLLASSVGIYELIRYTNDVYGVAVSWTMNVTVSALLLNLFFHRPDLRGVPYSATWFKLVGNVGGALFCFYWWPAQFTDGRLSTMFGGRPVTVFEPPSYAYLHLLYVLCPVLDVIMIYLVRKRKRELSGAGMVMDPVHAS